MKAMQGFFCPTLKALKGSDGTLMAISSDATFRSEVFEALRCALEQSERGSEERAEAERRSEVEAVIVSALEMLRFAWF